MMRCTFHRRCIALILISATLYVAHVAIATGVVRASQPAQPAAHVALILPLNSPAFGRHADAVRQGFIAAAKVAGASAPPIRVYPANEDTLNVLAVYEQAVESGANLVVGPLTRSGVAALAASNVVTVPTLALSTLEPRSPQPARMYLFGLGIETEARQIAQIAFRDGGRNAFIVVDNTPLGKRMRQAFVEEFARLGGRITAEFPYSADQAGLGKLRDAVGLGVANMTFLALDAKQAVTVRPYLGGASAIYATSQINTATATQGARELHRVRFIDMPWLLQADHPAVMVYPRPALGNGVDFERLYALGIDAFRIGLELLKQTRDPSIDGVTGRVRLNREQQFVRELTAAQFIDGKTVVTGDSR
jgi:uncharacterized protein